MLSLLLLLRTGCELWKALVATIFQIVTSASFTSSCRSLQVQLSLPTSVAERCGSMKCCTSEYSPGCRRGELFCKAARDLNAPGGAMSLLDQMGRVQQVA